MKRLKLFVPLLLIIVLMIGIGMSTMAQMSESVLRSAHDAEWTGKLPQCISKQLVTRQLDRVTNMNPPYVTSFQVYGLQPIASIFSEGSTERKADT